MIYSKAKIEEKNYIVERKQIIIKRNWEILPATKFDPFNESKSSEARDNDREHPSIVSNTQLMIQFLYEQNIHLKAHKILDKT